MNFEKLAALGAIATGLAALGAWVLLAFVTRPVSSGGIDAVTHLTLMAASFVPLSIFATVHVALGRQLQRGKSSILG